MGTTNDGQTALPRAKIDMQASVELTAWANALHVTEQELVAVVAKVGNDAREVITYLLKRADPPAPRRRRRS
jgi:hypothetical protein